MISMNGYEYIETRRGYRIFRKVERGVGKWLAVDANGKKKRISYFQARGIEPIDETEEMSQTLGRLLL